MARCMSFREVLGGFCGVLGPTPSLATSPIVPFPNPPNMALPDSSSKQTTTPLSAFGWVEGGYALLGSLGGYRLLEAVHEGAKWSRSLSLRVCAPTNSSR